MEEMKTDLITTNYKYYNVKAEDVLDKYGCVKDVEFAKYLIHLMWDNHQTKWNFSNVDEFLKKVDEKLTEFDGGFTFIDPVTERYSLGGPGGWSGIIFREASADFKEWVLDQDPDNRDLFYESTLNENPKVVVALGNQLVTFLVKELD